MVLSTPHYKDMNNSPIKEDSLKDNVWFRLFLLPSVLDGDIEDDEEYEEVCVCNDCRGTRKHWYIFI